MDKIKLSDIFKQYHLNIIKDTNGDFYIKSKKYDNLKNWTYAGYDMRTVIDTINDTVVKSKIEDVLFTNKDESKLLKAFAEPEKYIEDDIKSEFITKDKYVKDPDFNFCFLSMRHGIGYKADISGYKWEDIPDNAILYIPDCFIEFIKVWNHKATYVYTKEDLEKCIKEEGINKKYGIDIKEIYNKLSGETPELFDNLDYLNVGDKLYYNLDKTNIDYLSSIGLGDEYSLLVTVIKVNGNNIVCKDNAGKLYTFDTGWNKDEFKEYLSYKPMYPVKKNVKTHDMERD